MGKSLTVSLVSPNIFREKRRFWTTFCVRRVKLHRGVAEFCNVSYIKLCLYISHQIMKPT